MEGVRAELGIDAELCTTPIADPGRSSARPPPGLLTDRSTAATSSPALDPAEIALACQLYWHGHHFAAQPEERWLREALLRAAGRSCATARRRVSC